MINPGHKVEISNRLLSLDALRGIAILLMVLSGSIAFGNVMPAWMYHAQVPPPQHTFNPNLPGITWVDLVFPFFLFSMGAAIPIALTKKLADKGRITAIFQVIQRYFLLIFFAIFTYHARAWVMNPNSGTIENLLSVACFILLCLMFSKTQFEPVIISRIRRLLAFIIGILFLYLYKFKNGGFNINHSDIIIIVLANMALFGSIIWVLTKNRPWLRLSILPFVMAIFLSSKIEGSWPHDLYNWSPVPWAYSFYYLKYLFSIIIPGTFAGEWLISIARRKMFLMYPNKSLLIALICLLMVTLNTHFLFNRQLLLSLCTTLVFSAILLYFLIRTKSTQGYRNIAVAGIFLLLLGLCFEPFEGGIKKDPSTYSYYFVCAGMAFLTLLSFILIEALGYFKRPMKFIALIGQNPMIAYTAGNLLLLPLLRVFNLEITLNLLNSSAGGGFVRGLIFTTLVVLITLLFTKKRIFWKT